MIWLPGGLLSLPERLRGGGRRSSGVPAWKPR
jgi:hypothetical protein